MHTDGRRIYGPTTGPLGAGANPLVLLRRTAFVTDDGAPHREAVRALLEWAAARHLGQDPALLRQVAERRERAIAALCARPAVPPLAHTRLVVRPQWRFATGLGDQANPYEIGLALHGTYGCPVIPGSTLKGLTRAWARQAKVHETDPRTFGAVFGRGPGSAKVDGSQRLGGSAADGSQGPGSVATDDDRQGTVVFLDALPAGAPATITLDVVTPHVGPYYRNPAAEAPAEYHNPVPANFLAVSGGRFAIDLVGPEPDVAAAAGWCADAVDELGVGGKTSAGYGYLTVEGGS